MDIIVGIAKKDTIVISALGGCGGRIRRRTLFIRLIP